METGRTFYIPSKQQVCKSPVDLSVPITQDMNFYFNIVTVINFLTSVINAIIISVCYTKHKNLLSGILTVVMDTMEQKKVQALRLSDNELSTTNNLDVTIATNNDTDYININVSIPWIFLIVLLSLLIIFTLYWIFVLLIRPLIRKSSICRYILPCYRSHTDFLTPATDVLLDIVHVVHVRVFLTTISAPSCSLSFTGSVKITNLRLTRKNLLCTLHIDWYNCLLHYNDHVITLPSKGTAFSFQPNLLTSFSRPGPYNIQLLARHMDALLQIPHSSELDFVTASDLLTFPYRNPVNPTCPYQQIHDEVLSMMPLSDTPSASDPTLVDSTEQHEHFV